MGYPLNMQIMVDCSCDTEKGKLREITFYRNIARLIRQTIKSG